MMKTHVFSYPQASPLIFGPPHLCFGVWAELGGQTRGGSSFFCGRNVPCPLLLRPDVVGPPRKWTPWYLEYEIETEIKQLTNNDQV